MPRSRNRSRALVAVAPIPPTPPSEARQLGRTVLIVGATALAVGIGLTLKAAVPAGSTRADDGAELRVVAEDLEVETRLVPVSDALLPAQPWGGARTWRMPGFDRARAAALLAGLRGADESLRCDASGCVVEPALDAVAALSAADRSRIYGALVRFDHNPQAESTFYRAPGLGPFSAAPGVPESVRPLVDALTWTNHGVLAFSDLGVVCERLGSRAACAPFARAMLSRPTASVSLRLTGPGVIGRAAASFPATDRGAVRARLESARAAGVTLFPMEALLPAWARARLGTYPNPGEAWTNCFWTSLRFLDLADGPVVSGEAMDARLRRDFVRVTTAPQFGDVLMVRDAVRGAVHSATWLLDGYLFEKNGYGRLQAWRIVPLSQVLAGHPEAGAPELWRRREP